MSDNEQSVSSRAKKLVKVWDIPTRLFHWVLVILFAMSAYSAFEPKFGFYADMHLYSGVAVIALVLWRIIWGIFGSETARFSSFVKSPVAVIKYLKNSSSHKIGHNPIGGYSVLLMLVLILAQALLGLFATDGMLFSGPLSSDAGSYSDLITDIHEILGLSLLYITGGHILAVLFYLVVKKKNLIWPMITGKAHVNNNAKIPYFGSSILALAFAVIIGAMTYWYILG
jgi:cytochrome b